MNNSISKKFLLTITIVIVFFAILFIKFTDSNKKSLSNSQKKSVNNNSSKSITGSSSSSHEETESTTTSSSPSLEEKYSEMARNIKLEPEGTTISRYSDKDIDDPAVPGSFTKDKIISEELKITKRCKTKISDADKRWFTIIVYLETSSEPYEGKLAAANVILNRYYDDSDWFADTVKGVLFQEGQYPVPKDTKYYETIEAYDSGNFTSDNQLLCVRAIDDALNGKNNIGNRFFWGFYYLKKNEDHKDAVRIQNNLFWGM